MGTVDTNVDPMGDVDALVGLLEAAHLDRRRSAYVSFFVRFGDRSSWESAAGSDEVHTWQVSAYSNPDGLMIRLSRPIRLTARELEQNRDFIRVFANDHDGRWESLAIEDLTAPTAWDMLAAPHRPATESRTKAIPAPGVPAPSVHVQGAESGVATA